MADKADGLEAFFGSIWDTLVEAPPHEREYFTREAFIETATRRLRAVLEGK